MAIPTPTLESVRVKTVYYTIPIVWGFDSSDLNDLLEKLEFINRSLCMISVDKHLLNYTGDTASVRCDQFEKWCKGQKAWLEQLIKTCGNEQK